MEAQLNFENIYEIFCKAQKAHEVLLLLALNLVEPPTTKAFEPTLKIFSQEKKRGILVLTPAFPKEHLRLPS